MNVLCLCRSVLHITAWHSYCSLHGHARFPTDFRYCLILRSSKRYSDSRFQPQRQQVSELNFTLYCFFSSYYYHLKRARDWLQIDNNHSSLDQLHAYRNIRYFQNQTRVWMFVSCTEVRFAWVKVLLLIFTKEIKKNLSYGKTKKLIKQRLCRLFCLFPARVYHETLSETGFKPGAREWRRRVHVP